MNKKHLVELHRQVHNLKPVVIIGTNGLTDAVHVEIDNALDVHELIKIKINANDHDERQQMIDNICESHQATLIKKIGHIIAVFRPTKK